MCSCVLVCAHVFVNVMKRTDLWAFVSDPDSYEMGCHK